MEKATIKKLLEVVSEIVDERGVLWTEKAHDILREASDDDHANLEEFVSWFEKVES